jgi:hypothetical protein
MVDVVHRRVSGPFGTMYRSVTTNASQNLRDKIIALSTGL